MEEKEEKSKPSPPLMTILQIRWPVVWDMGWNVRDHVFFAKDITIKLWMPLSITSYKTIDGRGANVQISNGPCINLEKVSNVIIHGLHIHDCKPSNAGNILLTESTAPILMQIQDEVAISVVSCRDIWIKHNTLSRCVDGLVDVTLASTAVTISNNCFSFHDKAS